MHTTKNTYCAYRFGFNGKEKDDEAHGVTGSIYDYGFRIYDARIGKFLSVDPLFRSYPWYTPYQFAGNKPIWAIDLDGLEEKEVTDDGQRTIYGVYGIITKGPGAVVLTAEEIVKLTEEINQIYNSTPCFEVEENGKIIEVNIVFNIILVDVGEGTYPERRDAGMYDYDNDKYMGAVIKMGEANDPEFVKNKSTYAYHDPNSPTNDIVLNPAYYGEKATGFEKSTTNKAQGLVHEIGHDLGMQHEVGKYPKIESMANQGDYIPVQSELQSIDNAIPTVSKVTLSKPYTAPNSEN